MDLPGKYQDSAFIDRLHFYIPGWEVAIIRNEMFTAAFGFIVDYLAQVLKLQRSMDHSDAYRKLFALDESLSTRDKLAINKTFSGLMKIIYPHREATKEELEHVLVFAMEGRKRIKNEILKIDPTFDPVRFAYSDLETGERKEVMTAEELRYPMLRGHQTIPVPGGTEPSLGAVIPAGGNAVRIDSVSSPTGKDRETIPQPSKPTGPIHLTISENQTGISYRSLFADYLRGAKTITIVDPYIRKAYQIRNLVELMQVVLDVKPQGEEISVHLLTDYGDFNRSEIEDNSQKVQDDLMKVDIIFTYEFDTSRSIHARSLSTDSGWKISLDRGLDIFQRFESGLLSLASLDQRARYCKAFEVTYLRDENTGESL